MKETLKESGYTFVCKLKCGGILLHNINGNVYEIFYPRKNHASWGIRYKNTHLEFARTPEPEELETYIIPISKYEKSLNKKIAQPFDIRTLQDIQFSLQQ
jgi:hypothetical protein